MIILVSMKKEIKYFITVDWCNQGKRGIFCGKNGIGYWEKRPHTKEEMQKILGVFDLILNPKSEPFTEERLVKTKRWVPLAEYSYQYGIAIEK